MIKKELIEALEAIMTLLDDDNCPHISSSNIEVSKIDKVNKATEDSYNSLDILVGKIKYD